MQLVWDAHLRPVGDVQNVHKRNAVLSSLPLARCLQDRSSFAEQYVLSTHAWHCIEYTRMALH